MAEESSEGAAPTQEEIAEFREFKELTGLSGKQGAALIEDYIKIKDQQKAAPVKEPPAKAAKEEKPARSEADEKIKEDLYGIIPGLKNIDLLQQKVVQLESEIGEHAKDRFVNATVQAEEITAQWLTKELGVDLDTPEGQKYLDVVTKRVGNAIFSDQKRLDQLALGKATVAREVLKQMKKDGDFDVDNVPKRAPARPLPFMGRGNNPMTDVKVENKELEGLSHEERLQKISDRLYPQVWR
jgi:hypothetical protein